MRASTIYPQNNAAHNVQGAGNHTIIQQNQHKNCPPTKRCIRFSVFVFVVAVIVICAVAIPLALTMNRNKTTSQSKTESATENPSMQTIISTSPIETTRSSKTNPTYASSGNATIITSQGTTASAGSRGSDPTIITSQETMASAGSRGSDPTIITSQGTTASAGSRGSDPTVITSQETMASADSRGSDPTVITSQETTASADNNSPYTQSMVSIDTSTNMNSITNGWTNNMMKTSVSNTDATEKTFTTVPIEPKPTTRECIQILNRVNDRIIGLENTVAGGPNGDVYSIKPNNEMPKSAMDRNLATKYYNKPKTASKKSGAVGTGFIVIPSISNSTVACALHFGTAKDMPGRDPISVTLEGSNAIDEKVLELASSWKLIYHGPTGISDTMVPPRSQFVMKQDFNNTERFASYRLLVTSKRNSTSDAVQYSEAHIIGYT